MRFISSLVSLLATMAVMAVAQTQNKTAPGMLIFPQDVESCDNGGSETACRCDDGNCYMRGADEDCNLPVGNQVKCEDYYDLSD